MFVCGYAQFDILPLLCTLAIMHRFFQPIQFLPHTYSTVLHSLFSELPPTLDSYSYLGSWISTSQHVMNFQCFTSFVNHMRTCWLHFFCSSCIGDSINPWRACTARVTVVVSCVCVCVCVCPSVCLSLSVRSGTTGIKQAYERYLQPQRDKTQKHMCSFY